MESLNILTNGMDIVSEALIIIGISQLTQLPISMRMLDLMLHQKSNAIICLLILQMIIRINWFSGGETAVIAE